jgi:hypothetical protein
MIVSVFGRKMREDADPAAYEKLSARLDEIVTTGDFGLIGMRDFPGENGGNVFIAFFETEDGMRAWRREAEHVVAQDRGRSEFFEWYWGFVAEVTETYEFDGSGRRATSLDRWAPPGFELAAP